MIFPRWALSADKRLPLAGPRSIRTGLRRLISAQESRGATTALGAGAFGPARRRSPVVGAWFSSRLQPSIPLAPTSSICRLLNADARPFRGASQGSEGSSPPRTRAEPPRRTRGPGSSRFRAVFGRSWTHFCRRVQLFIAFDARAGSGRGLGRSRPIRRRISANRARGTATSASLKTT